MNDQFQNEITEQFIYNSKEDDNVQYDILPKNIYRFLTSGAKQKKIPDYQRPYSWKASNVEDFLNDILNISIKSNHSKNSWFLGSIYITKQSSSDNTAQVLDGQQRLTTLQIILRELHLSQYYFNDYEFGKKFGREVDNKVNNCLIIEEANGVEQRFVTDPVTNKYLKKYIEQTYDLESHEQYIQFYKAFEEDEDEGVKTSKSIKSLYENIKFVKTFIIENLFQNRQKITEIEDVVSIEDRIISFTKTLLYHFWIIEIPLKRESISIEIFEGLNNRGKPLTLVDKLQFKSLSKDFSENEFIKKSWNRIYQLLDELQRLKSNVFTDETDLFKSFFLGTSGKEMGNSDSEYLKIFEKDFLKSFEELETFFNLIKRIITFFIGLSDPKECEKKSFLKHQYKKDEKEKIKSLLYVLNKLTNEYKNTKYLIINMLSHFDDTEENNNYNIPRALWGIMSFSFYKNVFEGVPPNKVRTHFNSLIKNYLNKDHTVYVRLIDFIYKESEKEHSDDDITTALQLPNLKTNEKNKLVYELNKALDSDSSLLNTKKNIDAKLIILLFELLVDYKTILRYSNQEIDSSHLEHIFPRSWKTHWSSKTYEKEQASIYLKDKNETKLASFVNESNFFELKPYNTTPFIQEESLIEWIGNKLILNQDKNKSIKNNPFEEKFKNAYDAPTYMMVPSRTKFEGLKLDKKTDFTYKTIIDRSLFITSTIKNNLFSKNWDTIQDD